MRATGNDLCELFGYAPDDLSDAAADPVPPDRPRNTPSAEPWWLTRAMLGRGAGEGRAGDGAPRRAIPPHATIGSEYVTPTRGDAGLRLCQVATRDEDRESKSDHSRVGVGKPDHPEAK